MLTQRALLGFSLQKNYRFISQSARCFNLKNIDTGKDSSSTPANNNHGDSMNLKGKYIPGNFDKWLLTWVKKYPKGQIPDRIPEEVMIQAKSRARIKAANYMMVFSLLMCIVTIINVKKDIKKGDSIHKRNQDWHNKINEDYQASLKSQSSPPQ